MRQTNIDLVNRHIELIKQPVYDVGGNGFEFMWPFPVITVDITPGANIQNDCVDMRDISDNSAATVITTDTLEHIRDPFEAIKETYRILKPRGVLFLSTVFLWDYHKFPEDYFRFSLPALQYLCKEFTEIKSGWQQEDFPLDGKQVSSSRAGVYFIGKKT